MTIVSIHHYWYIFTMAAPFTIQLPLHARPRVLALSLGTHGSLPVERYRLNFWCLHFYHYKARVMIGKNEYPVEPGSCSLVPPNTDLVYWFSGTSTHLYAHFTLPGGRSGKMLKTSPMLELGPDFESLNADLEEAVSWFPRDPLRAEVRLWDILWRIAGKVQDTNRAETSHPAVEQVLRLVELRLGDPLRVTDLAREVGLSHNHLTRLFREHLASTVVGHIRKRRLERAHHLLRRTNRPIKSIANEVGIPDPHLFNKTIRRAFGLPPRALREGRR